MEQKEKIFSGARLARWLMLLLFMAVGIFIGQRIAYRNATLRIDNSVALSKLNLVIEQIQQNYVDSVNMPDFIEKAIPLVMEELDPHSVYIPASYMQKANESIEGNFDGIGVSFNMPSDTVVVMGVIPGGPSERAGVQLGDRIVSVDSRAIAGNSVPQDTVMKLLRGKRGTRVNIAVQRAGESKPVNIEIIRDKIPVKSVDAAYMIDKETGYIKISKFSKNTHEEFIDEVKSLQEQGMAEMVLDLRGNTGGLLDQAFEVANEFLKEGQLIVYTEGRMRPRQDYYANGRGMCKEMNVAVVIDENSASASEILAGALQDNDRGTIVGRRSFGKGLVQEPINFSDKSGIRLTVARYYTPTGRSIQKPYNKGAHAYESDIYDRYQHGEFTQVDSIKVNDSLRYETPKGKIVYGGGGIIPDVFVPIDTVGVNSFFIKIARRNFIYRFAMHFTDEHRKELNQIKEIAELQRFYAQYSFERMFLDYLKQNSVQPVMAEWNECKFIVDAQLKAYIGRNTPLDDNGYYPFLYPIDTTLRRAVNVLEKPV